MTKHRATERHTTFFNLTDALAEKGCALCSLSARVAHKYLDALLYESVNDPRTRKTLVASLGFCPSHARLARGMNDAFGIAIVYESLCREVAARIQKGDTPKFGACPVCRAVNESEARYVAEFGGHIGEGDFQEKFRASDGFCLAHFDSVMSHLRDSAARAVVCQHHAEKFVALAEELKVFIEKHDYQKAAAFGSEADAWQRALEKFVGKSW